MPLYPLFGLSQKGKSPSVTSQRHLNLYAEVTQDADKSGLVFYGTPGLLLQASFGETPVRGMIGIGDFVYVVHRGYLWKLANDGTKTQCGTLATAEGRVSMSYNGTQIGLVDGGHYYVYTIASNTFAEVTANLIGTPNDITYLDSYFILSFEQAASPDQRYQITDQYDGTTLNALDFASAESNPDPLTRIMGDHGELILAGSATIEFAANTGAQDFPYTSIKSATLEYGLAAPYSLVKFNDSVAGLFKNGMGQLQAMMLRGHALAPLGNDLNFNYLINSYSAPEDATAYSYMLGGHPMYQINFTTDNKSWLFDAITGLWSELEYGVNGGRHRGEIQLSSNGKTLVSDYANGNIYVLDADTYTDNGQPVAREIIGKHVHNNYDRMAVHSLQVDFEPGVGPTDGSEPQAMLQVSKDNGMTWGTILRTSIGAIGQYKTRAIWRRLGAARDWLFKIRITDPVKVVITGASIDGEPRK